MGKNAQRRKKRKQAVKAAARPPADPTATDDFTEMRKRMDALEAHKKDREEALRLRDELIEFFKDEDASPDVTFTVCLSIAVKQTKAWGRSKLWFLEQARRAWIDGTKKRVRTRGPGPKPARR